MPAPQRRRPTLADVAAAADVSVPTVSKVLRGGTDVSIRTREHVIPIAERLGYARKFRSRSGARGSQGPTRLIDLVTSTVEGTWPNRILSGVELEATAADRDVVLTVARPDRDWVQGLLKRPSEGAIVVLTDATSSQIKKLQAAAIPLVLIDPASRAPMNVANVAVTNWDGGRQAGEHLVALGHTRFGAIGGAKPHLFSRARIAGFRAALAKKSLALHPESVLSANYTREEAAHRAMTLFGQRARPTAIFAATDIMALGVYDAAAELGIDIPGDVSVVGFDDLPEASWATPTLTTIRQPTQEMGVAAVRMLLDLQEPAGPPATSFEAPRELLRTGLVVRDSTARIAEGAPLG